MACVFLVSTHGSSGFLLQGWDNNTIPIDQKA